MATYTQFRPLPLSRQMRVRSQLLHDMGSHHDDPAIPVWASAFCHTQIMVPAPIADACGNREQTLATLDDERCFCDAKRQGEAGRTATGQARSTQSGSPYHGTKVLACRKSNIEWDDVGPPLAEAATERHCIVLAPGAATNRQPLLLHRQQARLDPMATRVFSRKRVATRHSPRTIVEVRRGSTACPRPVGSQTRSTENAWCVARLK
jgi:hypothetical protein